MALLIKREEFEEKKLMLEDLSEDSLSLDDSLSAEEVHDEKLLELQLTMATTSINHEYARKEFDDSHDYERKEELLNYMSDCRTKYFSARTELARFNPLVLETFERDLLLQKLTTITHYHA